MSRHLDVVHLSGDEYDRLMDEREILRQECERAWKEVDAIQRERDDHLRWRKELADKLHDRETQISNAWAALRAAGVQSETNLADAIALLAKEQE